jgi:hypothetical protein
MTIELLAPIPAQGAVYMWEDVNEDRWVINVETFPFKNESVQTVLYGPLEGSWEHQRAVCEEVRDIVDATRRLAR